MGGHPRSCWPAAKWLSTHCSFSFIAGAGWPWLHNSLAACPPDLDFLACSKEEQALRATEAAQRRAELERRAAEKKAEEARQLRQAARDEARHMRCVAYWLWPRA